LLSPSPPLFPLPLHRTLPLCPMLPPPFPLRSVSLSFFLPCHSTCSVSGFTSFFANSPSPLSLIVFHLMSRLTSSPNRSNTQTCVGENMTDRTPSLWAIISFYRGPPPPPPGRGIVSRKNPLTSFPAGTLALDTLQSPPSDEPLEKRP